MNVVTTDLPGVLILEPKVFGDERGFFYESFNAKDFERLHGEKHGHYGIIICRTVDGLAEGDLGACRRRAKDIDALAKSQPSFKAQLVYVPSRE